MSDSNVGSSLWSVLIIVGPLLLVAALAWAVWRNRKSRVPKQVSEAGARRLYDREEELRREGVDGEEGRGS